MFSKKLIDIQMTSDLQHKYHKYIIERRIQIGFYLMQTFV